jgi:molecular chaperone GrpE
MSKKDTENPTEETPAKEGAEQPAAEPAPKELTPEEKLAELNDKYLRLYADFENYRKRMNKERADLIKFASEETFKHIIPVLDDFERAMKSISEKSDLDTIKKGNELIYNKFKSILTQNGLHEMKVVGAPFDPEVHDAVTNVPAPTPDQKGKVIEEVEKGYWLNGKVIRHAKVVVGQ